MSERETAVGYMETDSRADIVTSSVPWMKRLEARGSRPYKIRAFERGTGEQRYYSVPKAWIMCPYPSASRRKAGKYLTWELWQERGVKVQHTANDFPRAERETALSFIESEPMMEINTCQAVWQRRLESCGATPQGIDSPLDALAEFRWYIVPKSWAKLPSLRASVN